MNNKSKDKNLNTFCILPWIHLEIKQDGDVFPCCRSVVEKPLGNIQITTVDKILESEDFIKMRKELLNGDKSKYCTDCYHIEEKDGTSLRMRSNFTYAEEVDKVMVTEENSKSKFSGLQFLGIRFSKKCNLKCVYCSDFYSSAWCQEKESNEFEIINKLIPIIDKSKDTLKKIYIAGGEPLIDISHDRFLDYLIDNNLTHIVLNYNTNMTKINCLDKWKKFKSIIIDASIDSYGERNDFIRFGSKWDIIEKNVKKISNEMQNISMCFYVTVSIFNILTLDLSIKKWLKEGLVQLKLIKFNIVESPNYFSCNILERKKIVEIKKKLSMLLTEMFETYPTEEFLIFKKEVNTLLAFLDQKSIGTMDQFYLEAKKLSGLDNNKIEDIFPELF